MLCRDGLDHGRIRGVVVNCGNANASTGEQGLRDAEAMQAKAAEAARRRAADAVAVAETGTIGVPLPIEEVLRRDRRLRARSSRPAAPPTSPGRS